jgi:presenilin-like A22 family membrane protease
MKTSLKVVCLLLGMFFITQLIGIAVIGVYSPQTTQIDVNGTLTNLTTYNLPSWVAPPQEVDNGLSLTSIIIAIIMGVILMLLLMKLKAEIFLRIWFFVVVSIALGITINSLMLGIRYSEIISLLIAIPFAALKIFRRSFIIHNITEVLIYPGLAAVFVPLLNIWTMVVLLIFISVYDIYAVWHAGFMQKMAKYQMQKVKVFAGFFVPNIGKKERELINSAKKSKSKDKGKKIKINIAILGGGDVVFPLILAGVVLNTFGIVSALIISIGATLGLSSLFYISEKGKFYPAMPFITAGCLIALGLVYLINYLS